MKPHFDAIPNELKELDQWCLWKLQKRQANEKPTKIPYQINGKKASSTNKDTWASYQSIVEILNKSNVYDGIGFFFSENDPFCFIDLDESVKNEEIEQWASDILNKLNSYSEFSQSQKGIHIIIKGSLDGNIGNKRNKLEIYDRQRYCAITGYHISGFDKEINQRQNELIEIHGKFFPKKQYNETPTKNITPKTDNEIIEIIKKAKNADKFNRLMDGQWQSDYPSQSEADSALCWIIAYYTNDAGQIESIIRTSKLYRDKWDKNKSYLPRTINNALKNIMTSSSTKRSPKNKNEKIENTGGGTPQEKKIEYFKCTDYGNAERLIYYFGENIKYCHQQKSWYIWDGRRWKQDSNKHIYRMAKDTVRKIYAEAGTIEDDKIRKQVADHARKSEASSRIEAMISLAQSEIEVSVESHQLDSDLWTLNCLNGTLNLKIGKLSKFEKSDLLTKMIPIEYHPEAKFQMWDDFLDSATNGDRELIKFLQRSVGYTLTGDISEEKLFFISGPGGSGKSTFIEAIKSIISEYSKTADFESFVTHTFSGGTRNDIAALSGARFVSSIEIDEGKKLAEGLVKLITGGDTVTARFLYQEAFSFVPQFKLWLVANDKPQISPDDEGMWRRIIPINFDHVIPEDERDPLIKTTLKNPEISGSAILAWAVEGCLEWQRDGLRLTDSIKRNRSEYKDEMDYVKQYVEECCLVDDSDRAIISKQMLYNQYQQWCKNSGLRPMSKIIFTKKLKNAFPEVSEDCIGHNNSRIWHGITIIKMFTGANNEPDDLLSGS